jgi:hypothetical protein
MKQQSRIHNPTKIERLLIEKDLKDGKLVIVQFSNELYTDKILAELDELCLQYDENFSVRFYGHHFDCNTLLKLPNIKALWLDCLLDADNLDVLTELKNLKRLSLGIFELKDTEILQAKNFQNLEKLIISETRTKALNLKYLENYTNLDYLIISGHTKNIDAVGKLVNLKFLGLNNISKVQLDFINKLKRLKSLHFTLGGRENLDEIEENEIETLSIREVRAFNSFKNIANFKKLKSLLIEGQIQLTKIHFDKEMPILKLGIFNCKNLKTLTGLENLNELNQLKISTTSIIFEEFIKQTVPKSLNIFAFHTTKAKIDREIKEKLSKLGYNER